MFVIGLAVAFHGYPIPLRVTLHRARIESKKKRGRPANDQPALIHQPSMEEGAPNIFKKRKTDQPCNCKGGCNAGGRGRKCRCLMNKMKCCISCCCINCNNK